MKALLIAEKPDLMRKVRDAYMAKGFKDHLDFFALHGHIMTLKMPEQYDEEWKAWKLETLPIIPKKFEYIPTEKGTFDDLKAKIKAGGYDYLINCCDPDREGQHIFYSVYENLPQNMHLPVRRMWHNDLSQNELSRALNEMEDDLNTKRLVNLKEASKLRADMDWLIGINSTRPISIKRKVITRTGRVMTPTLNILATRELEIKNFKPSTSFGVETIYEEGFKGELWNNEPLRFRTEEEAKEFLTNAKTGTVEEVSQKETKYASPRLPSLGDIQADANKFYGYSLDETLELVQSLYEKKLCSYPRTDCSYVTKEIGQDFYFILNNIGADFPDERINQIRMNKNYVNDEKVTAHYAIIPTKNKAENLSSKEENIYKLICNRFKSIFMPDNIVSKTKIKTRIGDHIFLSDFTNTVQQGWKSLFKKPDSEIEIPNIKQGQTLHIKELKIAPHETKCPSRYNDASLLQAMIHAGNFVENKEMADILNSSKDDSAGIGTPATRAAIVKKLLEPVKTKTREFYLLVREKNQFRVTDEGLELMAKLGKFKISSPELTAYWEQKLRAVENGQTTVREIGNELIDFTKELTSELVNAEWDEFSNQSQLDICCPLCGEPLKETGNYYMCSKYKNPCSFIIGKEFMGAKINEKTLKEILGNGTSKALKLKSKDGKSFETKLKYNRETKKIEFNNDSSYKCPVCQKPLQKISTKYGKMLKCDDFTANYTIAGKTLTETQMAKLIQKGTSDTMTFTSKAGKPFNAKLVIKDGKVEFEFSPRVK